MTEGHRTSSIPRPRPDSRGGSSRPNTRPAQRPRQRIEKFTQPLAPPDDHPRPTSRLRDLTTPIPRGKQLVTRRRSRVVLGIFATLIVVAIGAALFVLPIKSWMHQRDQLATRAGELVTLDAANNQLQTEVNRLQTPGGIKEAAREEIDYVEKGEQRITVLPVGPASTNLPAGWPYDLVTTIVAIRQAEAVAAGTVNSTPISAAVAPATTSVSAVPAQP